MEQAIKVEWIDGEREPQCAPNPAYPNGKELKPVYVEPRVIVSPFPMTAAD